MKRWIEDVPYKATENREDRFGHQITLCNVKENLVVFHPGFSERQILWNKLICTPKKCVLRAITKASKKSARSLKNIQNEGSRTMTETRAVQSTSPDRHHWAGIQLCTIMLKDKILQTVSHRIGLQVGTKIRIGTTHRYGSCKSLQSKFAFLIKSFVRIVRLHDVIACMRYYPRCGFRGKE